MIVVVMRAHHLPHGAPREAAGERVQHRPRPFGTLRRFDHEQTRPLLYHQRMMRAPLGAPDAGAEGHERDGHWRRGGRGGGARPHRDGIRHHELRLIECGVARALVHDGGRELAPVRIDVHLPRQHHRAGRHPASECRLGRAVTEHRIVRQHDHQGRAPGRAVEVEREGIGPDQDPHAVERLLSPDAWRHRAHLRGIVDCVQHESLRLHVHRAARASESGGAHRCHRAVRLRHAEVRRQHLTHPVRPGRRRGGSRLLHERPSCARVVHDQRSVEHGRARRRGPSLLLSDPEGRRNESRAHVREAAERGFTSHRLRRASQQCRGGGRNGGPRRRGLRPEGRRQRDEERRKDQE